MDLSHLEATFEANKTPILAAAGAGVVGLGLYAKKKKAASTSTPAGAGTVGGASSGGQTAGMTGGAAYDSSASDLYGAIQPQLESLGGQLTDLRNLYASGSSSSGSSSSPTPVPAATAPPAATNTGAPLTTAAPPIPIPTTASYYASQLNAAGGSAAYTAGPVGSYVGRIDATNVPTSQQTYTPVATGVGQQALLSQQALPQTGSLGPVGTTFVDNGQRKQVTGYTFNGTPNVSWLY